MASPNAPKDKFFERVINPYLAEVLQHPQTIEMREGLLHIRDVEGPRRTGSTEARLEALEQEVFKCQEMVERGLNSNHIMITEFTNNHKLDVKDIAEAIFKLHEKNEHLQARIYDLQNQNCEYEYRFKRMSLAADLRIPETRSSFYDGEPMPTSLRHQQNHHLLHQQRRIEYLVWALPLATAELGGVRRYRITITSIFTIFLSSILLVIS